MASSMLGTFLAVTQTAFDNDIIYAFIYN